MKNRLKAVRESRDMTQEQVAGYLKISRSAYAHYESGRRDIPTEFLVKLAIR